MRQQYIAHLHVAAHSQQQTQVDAKGSDVGTGLAGYPEHRQVALLVVLIQLGLVDGTDTQLPLHSTDEGGSLE